MYLLVCVLMCCKSTDGYVSCDIHVVINPQQTPAPFLQPVSAGFLDAGKEVSLYYNFAQKTYNVVNIFCFQEQLLHEVLLPPILNCLLAQIRA